MEIKLLNTTYQGMTDRPSSLTHLSQRYTACWIPAEMNLRLSLCFRCRNASQWRYEVTLPHVSWPPRSWTRGVLLGYMPQLAWRLRGHREALSTTRSRSNEYDVTILWRYYPSIWRRRDNAHPCNANVSTIFGTLKLVVSIHEPENCEGQPVYLQLASHSLRIFREWGILICIIYEILKWTLNMKVISVSQIQNPLISLHGNWYQKMTLDMFRILYWNNCACNYITM
jgi:hypothetical protein